MIETATIERGDLMHEGKTKRVFATNVEGLGIFEAKDDLTAGDGAKHDLLSGKAAWATATTCNVFSLLKASGIPVAFEQQSGPTTFVGKLCKMIPLEVVCRREGHGSYLKRNPQLKKGHLFPKLICELYLKTSGRRWAEQTLPCDDPLIIFSSESANLYLPSKPIWDQEPFLKIPLDKFYAFVAGREMINQIEEIAKRTFLVLEKAWQLQRRRLVDYKVEFGMWNNPKGLWELYLADVIDSDSWRIIDESGGYADKQVYRDGGTLDEVAEKYRLTAELTGNFQLPRQQIITWRGSEKDDVTGVNFVLVQRHCVGFVESSLITRSGHKESVMAYDDLHKALQACPDSVIIAIIGMSNGAGPTIAASCMAPTITVPGTATEIPQDVWSSLNIPSNVPLMTVLNQKNATLAALQILAARNPALYAILRYEQEKRLVNIVQF